MKIDSNQHLLCALEIKRYILHNTFSNQQHMVTDKMLEDTFADNPKELKKILAGRSSAWFLEDYFNK